MVSSPTRRGLSWLLDWGGEWAWGKTRPSWKAWCVYFWIRIELKQKYTHQAFRTRLNIGEVKVQGKDDEPLIHLVDSTLWLDFYSLAPSEWQTEGFKTSHCYFSQFLVHCGYELTWWVRLRRKEALTESLMCILLDLHWRKIYTLL
jgi:hypothetical protein